MAARLHIKANAFTKAWRRRYGVTPAKHTVCLGLCQPEAETLCGDAWRGPDGILGTTDDTRNWGAATLRSLNAAEYAAIATAMTNALVKAGKTPRGTLKWLGTASVVWNQDGKVALLNAEEFAIIKLWLPTVGSDHAVRAKNAQEAIVAAGLPIPSATKRGMVVPRGEIHCDSTTELTADGKKVQTAYHVWFGAFDEDDQGAEYYLTFVGDAGNPARTVLDNPKGTVQQLASAVYARGYFYGFHPHTKYTTAGPDKVMGTADDVSHDGNQENVDAYAQWLRPHFTAITAGLQDWTPAGSSPTNDTEPAPPPPIDLRTRDGWQRALNALGSARPQLKIDGDFADKSKAALGAFQIICLSAIRPGELIDMTGKVDLETLACMRRDLAKLGVEFVG